MTVKMDARAVGIAYSNAFIRLRQLPGFSQKETLRAEAGSILKTWAGRTKVGTKQEADFRARLRAGKRSFGNLAGIDRNPYGITVNTGNRGGQSGEVWFRHPSKRFQQAGVIHDSGAFTPSNIHWKSSTWTNIQAGAERYGDALAGLLPYAAKSVGLARQSVIQIADELKIDLSTVKGQGISSAGIAKARAAIASTGRTVKNGSGYQSGDETKFYVDLINRLPYGAKIGMDAVLLGVVAGRAKYIETSYQKGAFDSIKSAAAAFPNLINVSKLAA